MHGSATSGSIAGASTFHFKGRAVDIAELRDRLSAGYVVQGSVRRAAGRVRISVQLIDAANGLQAWGDRYDGDMEDIFALQDEVTRTIAATLGVKIQDAALRRALSKQPAELDAYDCLLRARRYTWMLRADIHAEAATCSERAVELDPLSSDAHALLANVYLGEHRFDMNPRPDPIGRAMAHAWRRHSLIRRTPMRDAGWHRAFLPRREQQFRGRSGSARWSSTRTTRRHCRCRPLPGLHGRIRAGRRTDPARAAPQPAASRMVHFSFARLHFSRGQYQETVADVQRIGLPHFYWTHLLACAALGQMDSAEAAAALERIMEVKPDFSARAELRKWNAEPDDLEHIMKGLRKAGLRE